MDATWSYCTFSEGSKKKKCSRKLFSNHMSLPDVKRFNMSENWGDVWLSWARETFSRRRKGCRQRRHGRKDKLLIDKTALNDFVPHSWINECMELFGIADNVRNRLKKSMEQWKVLLTWRLMVKILESLMWKDGYFLEIAFRHYCLFGVWYLCHWYIEKVNAERKNRSWIICC